MSRSQRLFDLLQLLRCYKFPVSAEELASKLGVSTRTIYRDVATLQAQGAEIEGEAGLGYILKPSFDLPPMMFTMEELEALRLGAEWVAKQANGEFSEAVINALAKISAVLPAGHKAKHSEDIVRVASIINIPKVIVELSEIKQAIKNECKADITYIDAKQRESKRVVWPMLIGLFEQYHVLVAWCETRQGFRNFRLDRIQGWHKEDLKYPRSRHELLSEWEALEKISKKIYRY
ncbi:YafY family protein [Vibrio sp. 99-70-13A1]|uniref:helix-turn-helix transcriptional regulator n=1 Tax=Vibrio sp. 99-70-13A1 TaxID=2607601 RepID=UPI0014939109|nr:YafY family protein [Vibrio sp. 99-70-13A1]NOH95224.1 YafY family transcriptional regulator [Vibrio sp. 99-70-13A1]